MKRVPALQRAFSLFDLLITVALIGVLCAIAIPAYGDYVSRGRRFEARAGLLEAAHWLERWRTERGRYDDPDNANQPPPDFPWRQIPRQGPANYTVVVTTTPASYRITAVATRLMAADVCETLSLDETGLRGFTGTRASLEVCWNR